MDVHEQRVRFVVEATQGARSFTDLCGAYEISRPTGYVWLQRYRQSGVAGIVERSRKPHQSPRRTASPIEQQVVELRRRYPDWSARKLQVLLTDAGLRLPRNTIHRILQRHGLIGEVAGGAGGNATVRACPPQRALADGFQRPQPMARGKAGQTK